MAQPEVMEILKNNPDRYYSNKELGEMLGIVPSAIARNTKMLVRFGLVSTMMVRYHEPTKQKYIFIFRYKEGLKQ